METIYLAYIMAAISTIFLIYMVVKDSASNSNQDNLKESLEEKKLSSSSLQRCAMNICKTLLKTPAMERMLKKDLAEEAIPSTPIFSENLPDSDIPACHVDGKAVIDGSHISTKRGSSPRFLVSAAKSGIYRITFKVKSDVGAVAQIPMSVFSDEKLLSTITLTVMAAPGLFFSGMAHRDSGRYHKKQVLYKQRLLYRTFLPGLRNRCSPHDIDYR